MRTNRTHTKRQGIPESIVLDKKLENDLGVVAAYAVENIPGITIIYSQEPDAEVLSIGAVDFARKNKQVDVQFPASNIEGNWDLIYQTQEGGWIISGANLFSIIHASMTVIDRLVHGISHNEPVRKLRTPVFRSLELDFDDYSCGFSRAADGFDLEEHVKDIVRVGLQTFEINRLYDDVPIQVQERRVWWDKYQWWSTYMPALDMFFESTLNRGTYHKDMLDKNLKVMRESAAIARRYGLKPIMVAFEPRAWPERLYDHYPELRGARVDLANYSAEAEYAPDTNHPLVLEHYSELMTKLMTEIPDLDLFEVWAQDSCGGFPWAKMLYPGANGPVYSRKKPVSEGVIKLLTTLRDAGRKINPNLRVNICLSWFYPDEKEELLKCLPEDIGVSCTIHGDRNTGKRNWDILDLSRKYNHEPQIQIEEISNAWKPLGPLFGLPFPYLTADILSDAHRAGVKDLIFRGGITSSAFVPNFINNEVIREYQFEGENTDIEQLLNIKAGAWTSSREEAAVIKKVWRLCDDVVRSYDNRNVNWTVGMFVSARTLFRRLVRPVVPDQTLLTRDDKRYYSHMEFHVGATDPSWYDHFYYGYGQILDDNTALAKVKLMDSVLIPKLKEAIDAISNLAGEVSGVLTDLHDRVKAFLHMVETDRNIFEAQEAIHAYLNSEKTEHYDRLQNAIKREIENTESFIELLEKTNSVLIPETSGEETVYLFKAPLSHQLKRKTIAMKRHINDMPGPIIKDGYVQASYNSLEKSGF